MDRESLFVPLGVQRVLGEENVSRLEKFADCFPTLEEAQDEVAILIKFVQSYAWEPDMTPSLFFVDGYFQLAWDINHRLVEINL